jgi:hypothetical protein
LPGRRPVPGYGELLEESFDPDDDSVLDEPDPPDASPFDDDDEEDEDDSESDPFPDELVLVDKERESLR